MKASRSFRRTVSRQSGCYWCGLPMGKADPLAGDYRTREHLVPRSRGGTLLPGNIVAAHRACNERRGDDTRWVPFHAHGELGRVQVRGREGVWWLAPLAEYAERAAAKFARTAEAAYGHA